MVLFVDSLFAESLLVLSVLDLVVTLDETLETGEEIELGVEGAVNVEGEPTDDEASVGSLLYETSLTTCVELAVFVVLEGLSFVSIGFIC